MRGIRTDLAMETIGENGEKIDGVHVKTRQADGIRYTRIRIMQDRAAEMLGGEAKC